MTLPSELLPKSFNCQSNIYKQILHKISTLESLEDALPMVFIIHDMRDFSLIYMSKLGLEKLKITQEELRGYSDEYFIKFFNIEDVENYLPKFKAMSENNSDEIITFFQQVRTGEDGNFEWYLSGAKIFMRDENGLPLLSITMAMPINVHLHVTAKVERLMEENILLRESAHIFAALTAREKFILKYTALGDSSLKISKALNIAENTVKTHRRNIKQKLNAKSNYDITKFAQTFNLI
ncbi:helix-turn-helix transcriptional regulator [Chitinophaga sp. MM2321]|uniref:response regulator transcription factor n=1 Tax=Chitinophaga sp. MM2321 TaxID=3137178 RepID=UPI0032D588BA